MRSGLFQIVAVSRAYGDLRALAREFFGNRPAEPLLAAATMATRPTSPKSIISERSKTSMLSRKVRWRQIRDQNDEVPGNLFAPHAARH